MYRAPQTTNRTLSSVHAACRATAKRGFAFAFGAVPLPLVPGQKYRAGIELLRQGEIARDVWIIDEGAVTLVYFGEDGRELTVGVRLKGWILGSASVILGKPSPVAAVTTTPCYLQRLDAATFLDPRKLQLSHSFLRLLQD
jgi:CRP-like cAMP-binding protein